MKKKFIIIAAILLIAVMSLGAMLVALPDPGGGTGMPMASTDAGIANLAVMNGEVSLSTGNTIPAASPASIAGQTLIWLSLSASLVIVAVACRRRLTRFICLMNSSLRRSSNSIYESANAARKPRDCVFPASA